MNMYYTNALTIFSKKTDVLYSINISTQIPRLNYHYKMCIEILFLLHMCLLI